MMAVALLLPQPPTLHRSGVHGWLREFSACGAFALQLLWRV